MNFNFQINVIFLSFCKTLIFKKRGLYLRFWHFNINIHSYVLLLAFVSKSIAMINKSKFSNIIFKTILWFSGFLVYFGENLEF